MQVNFYFGNVEMIFFNKRLELTAKKNFLFQMVKKMFLKLTKINIPP